MSATGYNNFSVLLSYLFAWPRTRLAVQSSPHMQGVRKYAEGLSAQQERAAQAADYMGGADRVSVSFCAAESSANPRRVPIPLPPHRTGRADFQHPALRQTSHESTRGQRSRSRRADARAALRRAIKSSRDLSPRLFFILTSICQPS
jgi:hypothetical protein